MSLTEEQLLQWSTQGSTASYSHAKQFIERHLDKLPFIIKHRNTIEYILQGSYANSTNIRHDSDVDIVLKYNDTFRCNVSMLSQFEKKTFDNIYPNSDFSFTQFKQIIYNELYVELKEFTCVDDIEYRSKSLKVHLNNPKIDVDIVPCFEHRDYNSFSLNKKDDYIEGISFNNTTTGDRIINFPKLHIEHGHDKQESSGKNFKRTVRMVKKIKTLLVDKGQLDENRVSSYFIENLLYNVPDDCYVSSCRATLSKIVNSLSVSHIDDFVCQHEQWELFGTHSTQWKIDDAKYFIDKLKAVAREEIEL